MKIEAAIFSNGPYQLLSGLACSISKLYRKSDILLVGYDTNWNSKLNFIMREFSSWLGYKYINFPIEFPKSNAVLSRMNELSYYIILRKYLRFKTGFIPHIYYSPESVIINSDSSRKFFIYDDGISMYYSLLQTNGISPSTAAEKLIMRIPLQKIIDQVILCPSMPSLCNIRIIDGIEKDITGYSNVMGDLILFLAQKIRETQCYQNLNSRFNERPTLMVSLPRLNTKEAIERCIDFYREVVTWENANHYCFLIKPHPRDQISRLKFLYQFSTNNNIHFLKEPITLIPTEILSHVFNISMIITGFSTVSLNRRLTGCPVVTSKSLGGGTNNNSSELTHLITESGGMIANSNGELRNLINYSSES